MDYVDGNFYWDQVMVELNTHLFTQLTNLITEYCITFKVVQPKITRLSALKWVCPHFRACVPSRSGFIYFVDDCDEIYLQTTFENLKYQIVFTEQQRLYGMLPQHISYCQKSLDSLAYIIAEPAENILIVRILQRNVEKRWCELSHRCERNDNFNCFAHVPDYQCVILCCKSRISPYLLIKYDFSCGLISSKLVESLSDVFLLRGGLGTLYPCIEYQHRLVFPTTMPQSYRFQPAYQMIDIETGELVIEQAVVPPSFDHLPSWFSYKKHSYRTSKYFDYIGSSLLIFESKQEKNPLYAGKRKRKPNATDSRINKYLVKQYILWAEQGAMAPPQRFLLPHLPLKNNVEVTIGGNGTLMLSETEPYFAWSISERKQSDIIVIT